RVFLEDAGYRVQTAASGEEALRLARQGPPPQAITLDVKMPGGMDGLAVLMELKSDPALADIPVILLTVVDEERYLGFALGASDYLTKPVDPDRLLAVLRKHCARPTPGRALVVESAGPTRDLLCELLDKGGWKVTTADSAPAALELTA